MVCFGVRRWRSVAVGAAALVVWLLPGRAAAQQDGPAPTTRGRMLAEAGFKTDVPAHPYDLVLTSPTRNGITVGVLAYAEAEGFIEYGPAEGDFPHRTPVRTLRPGEPEHFRITGLAANRAYHYRLRFRPAADAGRKDFQASEPGEFRTGRARAEAFTFTIQADAHLDGAVTPAVYEDMLARALGDRPDFHVDLGDTFMTDKRRDFHEALPQYLAQRYYFGLLCRSAPLFMVLGNHDGEVGYAAGPGGMAAWSYEQRTKFFPPPPAPGPMYTGRTDLQDGRGHHYYAFEWGGALFVALDPFWPTTQKARGARGKGAAAEADTGLTDESWNLTLGREQYDWLDRTLEESKAGLKFVFIHHLVGGRGRAARGGVESAPYFEWGGRNADGSDGFAAHRPGWPRPVHQLLVECGVSAVFHGHDHLYVRGELDGVVYQCVPQPGNLSSGTGSAAEYGYQTGTIFASPGYLRVRAEGDSARVEFIRTGLEQGKPGKGGREAPGSVVHAYAIMARPKAAPAARPAAAPARAPEHPNFIVILGEGLGWSSTSVPMDGRSASPVPGLTPSLERLAEQGMRFSDFYVSAPRCTPARAALFTGIGAAKLHMTYVGESGVERRNGRERGAEPSLLQRLAPPESERELPLQVRTTAELLRDAGYATAHFGKWHVGRENPKVHGFEVNDGANSNVGPGGNREPNPEEGISITDKGIGFMAEQARAGRPFFLQMSHYAVGREAEVTPESMEMIRRLPAAARAREKELARLGGTRDLDEAVGRILAEVDELGIADRTYIVFTTDHGTPGQRENPPLAGGKGSVREGGIRVPLIIRGPGVKPGSVSSVRAGGIDLLPTFAELAGRPVVVDAAHRDDPTAVEGGSLAPVLRGKAGEVKRPREEFVVHFPHYDLSNGGPASAIYLGDYKLIRQDDPGRRMLFKISEDPDESRDLADEMPGQVREMEARLDAYLKSIDAPMARPAASDPKPK